MKARLFLDSAGIRASRLTAAKFGAAVLLFNATVSCTVSPPYDAYGSGIPIRASGAGATSQVQADPGQPQQQTQAAAPTPTPIPTPIAAAQNAGSANKAAVTVTLSTDSVVLLMGKSQTLQGVVTYADGTKDGNVSWTSTDSTIVGINPTTGQIRAIAPGVASIQAKSASDPTKFAVVTVTVKQGVVSDALADVTPTTASIPVGGTVALVGTLRDTAGNSSANGTWSSSDSTVAKINASGVVTGIRPGKATMTFTSDQDATVQASAGITVTGSASTSTAPPSSGATADASASGVTDSAASNSVAGR